VVVLPNASLVDTERRAEALREGIKALATPSSGADFPPVTMSVGVAAYPDHGQTSEEILAAADRALYRAKAEGRDRVAVADRDGMQGIEIAGA